MLVIDAIENIIEYDDLSTIEKENLLGYFEKHGMNLIIRMRDDCYCTYKQLSSGKEPGDIRVKYGMDMFLYSRNIVPEYGYAIVIGEDNYYKAIIRDESSTYVHPYAYTGGLDMWFLDEYDCIVLNDCNEYSVELCVAVLRLWKGKRLILVGENWGEMIPLLPDLPELECFYEPVLTAERLLELTYGTKTLKLVYGLPHQETMERYDQGIMTYDEVMAFTFMFADYREMGDANPDKQFFVMDGYYGNLGLFALFGKAECCARYVKSRGFIPVISITKAYNSFYQNYVGDDVWAKFYCQPEKYTLEEIMQSKHVYFSPGFYDGSIMDTIMNRKSAGVTLSWPNGVYNRQVLTTIGKKKWEFLPYPDKTLGVLARGTDYVKTAFHNHPIHANIEMICDKIDEMMKQDPSYEYIYVATEDAEYCKYFKERYGEKCYFTDQERYTVEAGDSLTVHHKKEGKNRDGFLMGMDYILSIELLAKCRGMIASGSCAGVWEARKRNQGEYKDWFVFDLGTNK